MFIAHLPTGYLLAKLLRKKTQQHLSWKTLLICGLMGSIFPDIDLIYFYLIDARQNNHHSYISHIPFYYLTLYLFVSVLFLITGNKRNLMISSVFMLGVLLHLILDTVAGGIIWYYPIYEQYVTLSVVKEKYNWWVLNFILHWSFVLELVIIIFSLFVYRRSRKVKLIAR